MKSFWARIRSWLVPVGVRPRDLILPISTLLLVTSIGWSSWTVYNAQEKNAAIIDVIGRQRVLLEEYSSLAEPGHIDQPKAAAKLAMLLGTAQALRDGGRIEASEDLSGPLDVAPAKSHAIHEKLDDQILLLGQFKDALKRHEAPTTQLLDDAFRNVKDTVALYLELSRARIRQALLGSLAAMFALALFGLLLNRLIVERRFRMQQLVEAKESAVRASEAKSQFLANMSHEIRTPLNAIIGMTEILQGSELSREQHRFIETLRRAGDTLLALINDILDLSKIESGQIALDLAETDLLELVERMGEVMALRAHQKGLELTCYVVPDVPRFVITDSTRLRQILMNLLGNAVKFTSAGEVALRVETQENDSSRSVLKFIVSDTGIGIPESKFDLIFENFAQVDPSIAVNFGGTGLGLAICKRLVKLLGGTIGVSSRIGVGSTFTFTIPVTVSTRSEQDRALPGSLAKGKRILVVDDNDTNRLIIRKYLGNTPSAIAEAKSGAEALEILRNARQTGSVPFDLVLLDYRMPGMTGIEVADAITRGDLARGASLVLFTSDSKRTDLGRLGDFGISEYIVKPLRKHELLEIVDRMFRQTQSPGLRGSDPTASPNPIAQAAHPAIRHRVLIVDDVEDNRFVITSFLGDSSCGIDEASNGQEAVSKAIEREYDVILMDMRMSPMDGYTATEKIREHESAHGGKRATIIALTAHALKEEVERALQAGCDIHLTKPITKAKLFETMQKFTNPLAEGTPVTGTLVSEAEDFIKRRLSGYIKNRESDLTRIQAALESGNFGLIAEIGHNIAGTAGIYGMDDLSVLARELELSAKSSRTEALSRIKAEMEEILRRVQMS